MDALDPVDRLIAGKREFGEFGGVNASVEISTTFTVLEADTLPAIFNGDVGPEKGGCYVYGRAFNPTVRHLGRQLAALEGFEAAYPCSSGMAAISSTLLALCNTGDHIVASNTIYGGSHALLKTFLPTKSSITTTFVDITDLAAVREALLQHPGRTKVVYTEVVSNPTLRVADLRALADLAHGSGAQLVVDNTFTPFVVTPSRFGADVVIHSLTKFVSGASDIIAGVICGSSAFIRSLMDFHEGPCMLLGPTMDPRVASELSLRLPHLALRMQEHGRRAAAFAARLAAVGAAVTYPGLPSHPQYELLAAQANPGYGFGGLLGLDLGSPARANAFMERLQNRHGFGFMAVSLGYFDTLMSLSAASTSSELSDADLATSGIGRGYVRMSVGITGSLEERWRQLEEAYSFAMRLAPAAAAPFRAVKVRRNPSSGVIEQLISWPSLGSFGSGLDTAAGTGGTAAAAAAVAGAGASDAKANGGCGSGSGSGSGSGDGSDNEGGSDARVAFEAALQAELLRRQVDAAGAAPHLEVHAVAPKAAAARTRAADEEEGDVTSPVLVAGPAPVSAGGTVVAGARFVASAGAAGGGNGHPSSTPVVVGATVGPVLSGGVGVAAGACVAAGSEGTWPALGAGHSHGSPQVLESDGDAAGGERARELESWRPVKIQRTDSGEVHYLAIKRKE